MQTNICTHVHLMKGLLWFIDYVYSVNTTISYFCKSSFTLFLCSQHSPIKIVQNTEVFRIFDRMFQKRPFHDLYIYICKYRDAKLQMVRYYRVCNVSAIADLVFALLAGGPF